MSYRPRQTHPLPPPSNRPVNRKPRDNSGSVSLSEKYYTRPSSHRFWKRELFSLCRGYWSAATKCPRNTCSWQTSYTTWGTTLAIRSFNADVTMTFSSFGCNGAPRYKIHYIVREPPLYFLVIHRLCSCIEEHYKQHYSTAIYQFLLGDKFIILSLGFRRFRETHGSADGADGVHG